MALVTKTYTFASGETVKSAEVNLNFDTLYNDHNGNITNANIAAGAAIVGSKLDLSSPGNIGASTPGVASFTSANATSIYSSGDIYTVPLTNYSSLTTANGWASFSGKEVYYRKVGKIVYVSFYIGGASNSTASTFTVPFTAADIPAYWGGPMVGCTDNGTEVSTAARAVVGFNSNLVTLFKDMGLGPWTNSGTKVVYGSLWYESA